MKGYAIVLGAALFAAQASAAPVIKDSSYRDLYGHRVQQLSVVVNAPVAKVWDAFMTDKGFVTWAVPVAHVTVENGGGMMESSYMLTSKVGDPDNIKNEIVAYLPYKMIAMRNAHVPKGAPFDPVLIASIRTVIQFEPAGHGRTKVIQSQVGYGEGDGYDTMYKHFRDGNAEELTSLADSFTKGPVDWQAQAAAMNAAVHKGETK
ncbi:MAG TPA: SRPBCC domain-containing protein [Rhizomicrobium sp.]|jgi:uncharacterized protein YndB with AHSA1/START domain